MLLCKMFVYACESCYKCGPKEGGWDKKDCLPIWCWYPDFILYLQHKQTQGRLATALIYFYKEVYRNTKFKLTISRREIAEVVGMSNENIVRELTRFGKEGIIKTEGRMMEIINPDKLQKISDLG